MLLCPFGMLEIFHKSKKIKFINKKDQMRAQKLVICRGYGCCP